MRSPLPPHGLELGDTTDPAELVPGNPGALFTYAQEYRDAADKSERMAGALRQLRRIDRWEGEAADAYEQYVAKMARDWDKLTENLRAAARAWEDYATVVGWGQQKAGDAIAMFAQAAALSAAAPAQPQKPAFGTRGSQMPAPATPPADPGASVRGDARELLEYARQTVADAAADAVRVLRTIAPTGTASGGSWNPLASVGNALVQHPDALMEIVGGAAMMLGGGALFGGGVAADATGVGAVAGVPANAAGAALVSGGATLAGAGVMNAAAHATGDSAVFDDRADRGDGRDAKGRFTGKGGRPWEDKEKAGLDQVEEDLEDGEELLRDKVAVKVEGSSQTRYFDGLIKNEDGTYTGVEVKSGSAVGRYLANAKNQFAFDSSLSPSNPATGRLNGEVIKVVNAMLKEMP